MFGAERLCGPCAGRLGDACSAAGKLASSLASPLFVASSKRAVRFFHMHMHTCARVQTCMHMNARTTDMLHPLPASSTPIVLGT